MKNGYISVIGSLNYDIIMKQQRLPLEGETYTADSIAYEGGGKGANQAVQCAKLGAPTYMFGKVGEDDFGIKLLDNLKKYGVKTDYVYKSRRDTGVGVVHVLEDGSVYATIIAGANFDFEEEDMQVLYEVIKKSSIIVLQMEIPIPFVEEAIKFASEEDVYVILNAAPAKAITPEVLKLVDCLVVNESEASFYVGEEISDLETAKQHYKTLTGKVKNTVIMTLGEKGSLLCSNQGYKVIPVVEVKNAIETTGAGDSYIGTFAYCKYKGYSDEKACQTAAKAAAITVGKIGAQIAMPDYNDIFSR